MSNNLFNTLLSAPNGRLFLCRDDGNHFPRSLKIVIRIGKNWNSATPPIRRVRDFSSKSHSQLLLSVYEIRFRHYHFRRTRRHFLGDGATIIPHQRYADWQTDGDAQARRVLVETRTLAAWTGRRAGEPTAANDLGVSQRHSHRPLERQQRQEGQLHAARGIQHSREEANALLEKV